MHAVYPNAIIRFPLLAIGRGVHHGVMKDAVLHGIFWNHLIYPELASNEVADPAAAVAPLVEERLAGGPWPDYVVCLVVVGLEAVEAEERRRLVDRLEGLAMDTLAPGQCSLLGFAHTNALYFYGLLGEERAAFIDRLSALRENVAGCLGLASSIGVAWLPEPTLPGLQWAAQHAIVAQRQRIRAGVNGVFVFDAANFPRAFDQRAYWALVQRMHLAVRKGDIEAAEGLLDDITRALFYQTNLALQHLRPVMQCLVVFMAQAATEVLVDPVALAEKSQFYLWELGSVYDYGRLRDVLRDAALTFTGLVHNRYHNLRHRLVATVDEYIAAHLADPDLSLHQIACALAGSPSHISRTYKKVKGVGITRAINQRRVEAAQRGLLDHDRSVTDVALDSGFTSLQHFGRVFREIAGCTPTEFRKRSAG